MSDARNSNTEQEMSLQAENRALEDEIRQRGGLYNRDPDLDPAVENTFLRQMLTFEAAESGPQIPFRDLFPKDTSFPPADALNDAQIDEQLEAIEAVFASAGVFFAFAIALPARVLYKHLVEESIPYGDMPLLEGTGMSLYLDGCGGDCEHCFQQPYCTVLEEIP